MTLSNIIPKQSPFKCTYWSVWHINSIHTQFLHYQSSLETLWIKLDRLQALTLYNFNNINECQLVVSMRILNFCTSSCLTKLCSLCWGGGQTDGRDRLDVNWFCAQIVGVQLVETFKPKAWRCVTEGGQWDEQTHPSLSGAPRFGSLGSMRVFDSSSKLGSSICNSQSAHKQILYMTQHFRHCVNDCRLGVLE